RRQAIWADRSAGPFSSVVAWSSDRFSPAPTRAGPSTRGAASPSSGQPNGKAWAFLVRGGVGGARTMGAGAAGAGIGGAAGSLNVVHLYRASGRLTGLRTRCPI